MRLCFYRISAQSTLVGNSRATRLTFHCFWPQRGEVAEGVRRCGVRCGNLSVSFRLDTGGKKNYSMTTARAASERLNVSADRTQQLNFVAKYFVVQNELQRKHNERGSVCVWERASETQWERERESEVRTRGSRWQPSDPFDGASCRACALLCVQTAAAGAHQCNNRVCCPCRWSCLFVAAAGVVVAPLVVAPLVVGANWTAGDR